MIKFKSSLLLASLLALSASVSPGHAQQARSFVSGLGSDTNAPNCIRTAPCRTFQVAHDNTLAAGEITVLDPGSYGGVTITKAISIINDGVGEAGALVSGGSNGITINVGATDAVSLRGLTIKGIGFGGGNGIVFNAGGSLTIENCVIRTLSGQSLGTGITFSPQNTTSSLFVSNTVVTGNSNIGLLVNVASGIANAILNRVEASSNATNFEFFSTGTGVINATVDNSVAGLAKATVNSAGFFAAAMNSGSTNLMITRSVASLNSVGLLVNAITNTAGAIIRLGSSTVTQNNVTWSTFSSSGSMVSFGDNFVAGNSDLDPPFPILIGHH